jgi:glutaredoxin
MKKIAFLGVLFSMFVARSSFAADITIYYAPSCPHCHHAREFISNTLVYEYPELKVTAIDVTIPEHRSLFKSALDKCGLTSGGVPVLVIGEHCEQGYADYMEQDLRKYVEADLTPEQKQIASSNRRAMKQNIAAFKEENLQRSDVIVEYAQQPVAEANDTTDGGVMRMDRRLFLLGGMLILIVAGLGYALVRKSK